MRCGWQFGGDYGCVEVAGEVGSMEVVGAQGSEVAWVLDGVRCGR